MKRLSLWLALALVAAFVSALVAPQMIIAAIALTSEAPSVVQHASGLAAQEVGLWGSALATYVVARRLGWRGSAVEVVALLAVPIAAEGAVGLLFGTLPLAYLSVAGGAARLLAGGGAIAAAIYLRR